VAADRVRLEKEHWGPAEHDVFEALANAVISRLITTLVSQVWLKRANRIELMNTDGDSMLIIDATVAVSGDVTRLLLRLLLRRPDFAGEKDGGDGEFFWRGGLVDELDGLLGPDEVERWVLGRVAPGDGRIRVRVNSRRLDRLVRILTALGVKPRVTEEKWTEPSLDFSWGSLPDGSTAAARIRDGTWKRAGWIRR
jgi:hypothetical protein